MHCNLCFSNKILNVGKVGKEKLSVTSEPRLVGLYSYIYTCKHCGHIQKIFKKDERNFVEFLYRDYRPHFLSNGTEQLTFAKDSKPRPRTYHAIEKCVPFLPEAGNLLDIGSGNGAVLKSASELLPRWKLHALDITERYKTEILKIKNVISFTCATVDKVPSGKYDLIVLWHVLEHMASPKSTIMDVIEKLSDRGFLLVQVPDIQRNPFDLAVIDHNSHFTHDLLKDFFDSMGFVVAANGHKWFHNCLTLLLQKKKHASTIISRRQNKNRFPSYQYIRWVNETIDSFENMTKGEIFSIFGTGMASMWVYGQLSQKCISFLDEDCTRIGKHFDSTPIMSPDSIPDDIVNIVMPFRHARGVDIAERLKATYKKCSTRNFIIAEED